MKGSGRIKEVVSEIYHSPVRTGSGKRRVEQDRGSVGHCKGNGRSGTQGLKVEVDQYRVSGRGIVMSV